MYAFRLRHKQQVFPSAALTSHIKQHPFPPPALTCRDKQQVFPSAALTSHNKQQLFFCAALALWSLREVHCDLISSNVGTDYLFM